MKLIKVLESLDSGKIYKRQDKFDDLIKTSFEAANLNITTALYNKIVMSLSARDQTAEVVVDSKGKPKHDRQLRDYENIPIKENINEYFNREILLHMPGAWIDVESTKIGYIIYINRYFYNHVKTKTSSNLKSNLDKIQTKISDAVEAISTGMLPGKRMVESDCEWFPHIPEGWDILRAKWLFDNVNSRGHSDEPLLSVTQEHGILPRDELEINVWNPKEDVSGYKLVEPGDFVISLRSFQGGIEYSGIRGIVSPAYTVLRPMRPELTPYFRWFLKSKAVIEGLKALSTGIRQGKTIQYSDFCELPCLVPQKDEAISIANLLDQKAQMISELKKQMRKLHDNHSDLVSSAVIGKVNFIKETS